MEILKLLKQVEIISQWEFVNSTKNKLVYYSKTHNACALIFKNYTEIYFEPIFKNIVGKTPNCFNKKITINND